MTSERMLAYEDTGQLAHDEERHSSEVDKTIDRRQLFQEADPEMDGLTLYEKKSLIINRELDRQGMGRYQWMIFLLCGFGYLLDLLWAHAFGVAVPAMQVEFGFSDGAYGNIFTSFSAGLAAGAFSWGILVDIIGRYWAFNFTVLISSIFGICIGAPDSYNAVIVLTAFCGIGVGGNIPIDTTITLEFLPQNRRWLLPMLSVFQPLGVVLCTVIAYGFIPNYSCEVKTACSEVTPGQPCCTKSSNYGWRYLFYTLGCITILIFFLRFVVFSFQESPKYLLSRGQDEKAIKVLQHIAKFNKQECQVTLETFAALEDDASSTSTDRSSEAILGGGVKRSGAGLNEKVKLEVERYKLLFANATIARITILVWLIYMWDYWGFTIAGSFLPKILKNNGEAQGQTLRQTYLSYIYIYVCGIPGVLLGTTIYRWRWASLLFSSALFGACLFIYTAVHTIGTYIGISALVFFFQSLFNAILYGWTPEVFPAPIRGTACGVASFWGRLFAIIAPLAAQGVFAKDPDGHTVLYMAGAGVFVSTVAILLLPRKSLGTQSF